MSSSINQMMNFSYYTWWVKVLVSLLFGVVVSLVLKFILLHLEKHLKRGKVIWHYSLIKACGAPFWASIWLLVLTIIFQISTHAFSFHSWDSYMSPLRRFLLVSLIAWTALRFIKYYEKNAYAAIWSGNIKYDRTSVRALMQLLRIITLVLTILVLMQTLGIKISALLAFGGIGGLAVSLAAKDNLANMLSGMMIFIDRPFSVGDWISSPDRNIEGTVEAIGWRLTLIRTFDKRPLYVPNGAFSTISVENPSRMSNRRIYTKIGLRYEDASKVATILKAIETMLKAHPDIDASQTIMVNLVEFSDSSLVFFVYAFTKTTHWETFQEVQQDVFLKILEIIDQHDAACAFPTSTVHFPDHLRVTQQGV